MTIKSNSTATGASFALPAAQDTPAQLYELHNLLRLCAFAAEARRTLQGYADCEESNIIPKEVQEALSKEIPARCQWELMPDSLGYVLEGLAERIEGLARHEASKRLTRRKGGAA